MDRVEISGGSMRMTCLQSILTTYAFPGDAERISSICAPNRP